MNISKEQALAKIEELKNYVSELDKKKEEKVVGIAVMSRFSGIKFQSTKTTFKEAVVEGKANLRDADLCGTDLRNTELQNAKFYGRGGTKVIKKANLGGFLRALGFVLEE